MNLQQLIADVETALINACENGYYTDSIPDVTWMPEDMTDGVTWVAEDMIDYDSDIAKYSLAEVTTALWSIINAHDLVNQKRFTLILGALDQAFANRASRKIFSPSLVSVTVTWLPIEQAPKDRPLWLFSPEFIDEDFNPSGVVDGHWNCDAGWVCWSWNGCQDCYDTLEGQGPTHYAEKIPPNRSET